MATECLKPFKGRVMRITKLNSCGAFTASANQVVVTEGFISVEQTINWRDPDEYEAVNANGRLCVNERGAPQLKWVDVTINLCEVDVEAWNFLTGAPIVVDEATPTPNNVGFRLRENTYGNFAIEVWTDLAGQTCSTTPKFGYLLLPWLTDGNAGDLTIENATANFSAKARTKNNSPWGVGWANVRNTAGVTPAPAKLLTAITAADHRHMEVVNLAPPSPACGSTALVVAV